MNFLNIVKNWHNKNESEISHENVLFYLIELFQELKEADFDKNSLKEVGDKLLFLLDLDMIDESVHMIYQRMLAEEIKLAYRIVNRNIKEIKEEPINIQQVIPIDDGDIYPNDTDEPDIDLRGVDLGEISFDEEFIKELGINK